MDLITFKFISDLPQSVLFKPVFLLDMMAAVFASCVK